MHFNIKNVDFGHSKIINFLTLMQMSNCITSKFKFAFLLVSQVIFSESTQKLAQSTFSFSHSFR